MPHASVSRASYKREKDNLIGVLFLDSRLNARVALKSYLAIMGEWSVVLAMGTTDHRMMVRGNGPRNHQVRGPFYPAKDTQHVPDVGGTSVLFDFLII